MDYVIIGNGTAAVACIEGIRSEDASGSIALISSENRHCYGRPLISYLLSGAIKAENADYRPRDFYQNNGVKTYLGKTVSRIAPNEKRVYLSDGASLEYGKLLIATGSRPFVPPMEGLESVKDRFTFMTFDDMEKLSRVLSPEKSALIIGAGLIGLKCAEGMYGSVKSITVVDMADRILPSVLNSDCSAMMQAMLSAKGINFILNDSAAKFEKNSVTLKSGKKLTFDILVTAVGVRPETSLAAEAGIEVDRGIVVNAKSETNIPDIYAAGDCSEGYDMSTGTKRVLAILPNAYMQGKCAGVNMAGGVSSFMNAVPLNAVGFFGWHVLTAGCYEGEAFEERTATTYKKLFVKEGRLVGFILLNDIQRAGIYTSLIREKTPLSEVDFELLKNAPQLLAFSKQARAAKLTRKV